MNNLSVEGLTPLLAGGIEALGLELPESAMGRLLEYIALLTKWNRAYNLTAVRDPRQMVARHLLDSLTVLPHLQRLLPPGRGAIDLGSGAGLPGIPLAVGCPDRHFVLLDSNRKKTRFLSQAAAELGLHNVSVVYARVEEYRPEESFDVIVSRAFSSLADMLALAGHLLAPGGCFLAMKGAYPVAEVAHLPPNVKTMEILDLAVPGLDAARHLVYLVPEAAGKNEPATK